MNSSHSASTLPQRLLISVVLASLAVQLLGVTSAQAADIGIRDFSYRDDNSVQVPTEDKTQSKLWFQDGRWWGLLYSPTSHTTNIHALDDTHRSWSDTGTVVDGRPAARGDALWDGQKLYVVSGTTVVSDYGSPPNPDDVAAGSALLSRFSYDPVAKTYALDQGFPVTTHEGSSESVTVAKDSLGVLWVTYTKVSPDNTSQVYVVHSVGSDTVWGAPMVVPTTGASVHYDDISAVVAFGGDKIGIMWSNEWTRKFYFASHRDGAPDASWQIEIAYGGGAGGCTTGCANDHVNLKQLSTDGSGRVFAAIKTANRNPGQPFVVLLVRDRHATWSAHQFGAVENLHTRPMVMIDEEHRQVFMFAVSPEVGGTIYYKKSSLDNIAFPLGLGTPLMQSTLDSDISNPTSTKQTANSTTGIVVLASANRNQYYWHSYLDLASEPPPAPAAPTNTTVSAPLTNADNTLKLSWLDNSNNEDGFAVERKTGTGAYGEVVRLPINVTSYTDSTLSPGTTYTYRVRAFNSVGYSAFDDEVSGTTAQTGPVRTFIPFADTYVDSAVPNTNFGMATLLKVDASPVQESYLKFQLSGLTGNTVTSAKLRVYLSDNGSVKGGSVARMSDMAWSETATTYGTRPTIDGAVLANLGAVSIGTWYELDVTPAVSGDGVVSLGIKSSSTDGAHYASREDAAHAPQLVITVAPGDSTAPDTTIDAGPSGSVTADTASFAFSANEVGSTFECALDGAPFTACTSPKQYTALVQGIHSFSVRATDAVGNTDPTVAGRTWTVDTIAPSTILEAIPALTKSTDQTFSFSADETGTTYACNLDDSGFALCSSPAIYTNLIDGSHTFSVRATDVAGNTDQEPATATWTIDTRAPDTTITAGAQGTSTVSSATFTFASSETQSTFQCSLDQSNYAPCTSPTTYADLAEGDHTFGVRAIDLAGNVDLTPDTRAWIVDTSITDSTAPAATLTTPADGAVVRGTVDVTAIATDNVAVDHVEFLVNGIVVASDATSPYGATWDSTSIADGSATLTARATDTSDNIALSGTRTVLVDNTVPDTAIDSGPAAIIASTSATFSFSSPDQSATFECRGDGANFTPCVSPISYTGLSQGPHTFEVRAKDPAGNVDASPAAWAWTADTTPPDTTITSSPSGAVNSRTADLQFSSTEAAASTFACSLDSGAFAACVSPRQYTGLSDGVHTFSVRATDGAGNIDATPASASWTVDPIAFSDGFESGDFSKWSSVQKAINGTATVQNGVVKTGTYAAQIGAPSNTSYAYLRQTLAASQKDLTVSGDFDITVQGADGQEVPIFKLYDASMVRLVYVYRRNTSGRIYVVYGGTTYPSSAKLALGAWARFDVRTAAAGSGASTVEVTMNGVNIYRSLVASLGTSGIRTIQVGNDKQLPFNLYVDNVQARL